ncbi:response regulator transcription factor [Neptunomonas japonica]|uniref:LuxR family transcriptional regulator n=1 Tax=Neptunomonas japonica JAMM 1380 TaxID=1441457 RepID=A0A7R6SXF4_9GAMM|nr:response regulator transcription factor [Neptunomonas japonica]BBB30617.1 LuxR family transcriptional regulator [Neptunomonas japonica JAMM 1380]
MKLYIVSANKEVVARWTAYAGENSVEVIELDQLLLHKVSQPGCGLVHIGALNADSVEQLCVLHPHIKWVAMSDYPCDAEGLQCLEKGFRGYINTYVSQSLFSELLNVVANNDIWAGPSITQILLKQYLGNAAKPKPVSNVNSAVSYGFTDREEEVLNSLVTGASNKEIARVLGITERTVKAHVAALLNKTGTKDRLLLVLKLTHQVA